MLRSNLLAFAAAIDPVERQCDAPDMGSAEVVIGKQGNGPIGTMMLTFQEEHTRFAVC